MLSKRVIDPAAVCSAIHLCPVSTVNITDELLIILHKWISRLLPDDGSHDKFDVVSGTQRPSSLSSYEPVISKKNDDAQKIKSSGTNNRPLRILQISDLHVDTLYKEVSC